MQYRPLGRTNLNVSVIGLGTMTWGQQNTQDQAFKQMDYAIEQGINFFDTAEMYAIPPSAKTFGTTETIIGNWFASRGKRHQVILASKISGPGLDWIRQGNNKINQENIIKAVEGSLQRLQTDYIDLYQLHWPNRDFYHFGKLWDFEANFDARAEEDQFLEVLTTLHTLIQAGKIRHIGLSNESAWGLMKWLNIAEKNNLPRMASIQNEYSLLCRHFEPDLSEIAIHENCGLLAWSPLCRGMLSGKYLNGARPAGARITIETRPEHRVLPKTDEAIKKYIALAKQHQLEPTQMALAFVHQKKFVTSTLIGATTMKQLKSNIASIHLTLSPEVSQGIHDIRRDYPTIF